MIADGRMIAGRTLFGCAIVSENTEIFAIGGEISADSYTNTIEKYNIMDDEWEMLNDSQLTFERVFHSCIAYLNEIYILGGDGYKDDIPFEYIPMVDILDINTHEITLDDSFLLYGVKYFQTQYFEYSVNINDSDHDWFQVLFIIAGKTSTGYSDVIQYQVMDYFIVDECMLYFFIFHSVLLFYCFIIKCQMVCLVWMVFGSCSLLYLVYYWF